MFISQENRTSLIFYFQTNFGAEIPHFFVEVYVSSFFFFAPAILKNYACQRSIVVRQKERQVSKSNLISAVVNLRANHQYRP